ncbi:hypothetical protein D9611_004880 [Ephemerocybe angulata]|uniref:Uncharacterized protein n=1 Tax=Ephemerocybe angulata TaxID=980116 RepID=A0A8H5B2Z3_9AGAR|nr:hypothetical protein D9611_004880 [Tulosesus angulatus]
MPLDFSSLSDLSFCTPTLLYDYSPGVCSVFAVAMAKGMILAVLLLAPLVSGQGSNVTTCVDSLSWSLNTKGQNPCFVVAHLYGACNREVFVPALPPNTEYVYIGPDLKHIDACSCSTAAYMLTSACGACQGRNWDTWPRWSRNCSEIVVGFSEAVPVGLELPEWALLDVSKMVRFTSLLIVSRVLSRLNPKASQSFDPAQARLAAQPPASTTSSTTALVQPTTSPATTTEKAQKRRSSVGAIVGGVVGGLIFSAIIGLAVFWLFLERRKKKARALKIDLTAGDHHDAHHTPFHKGSAARRAYAATSSSRPPLSVVGGHSYKSQDGRTSPSTSHEHARQMSSASSESRVIEVTPAPNYAMIMGHNANRSMDNVNRSPHAIGNVLVPGGYTGAAEVT